MGADKVINHRNKLSEELGGSNIVDVVFCTADLFHHAEECVKVVKPLGNLITITGYATVTFGWDFAYKRISVHFEYMSARYHHHSLPRPSPSPASCCFCVYLYSRCVFRVRITPATVNHR